MKKKKSIIVLSIALCILSAGCEDLVDIKPTSSISSESFWQDESDVRSALYGMYNQFRATFDVKTVIWGDFRTAYYGQGTATATNWDEIWKNNLNSTTSGTNWSDLYLLVNDANLIITNTADITFQNESEKGHILGQAYFVRAFAYFQIVKLWGNAPVVTEGFQSTEQNLTPARSPKAEVFALIKDDLERALSLLGEAESVNYIGKSAANMLKANVYLWTARLENGGDNDLQQAQAAVNEVLGAGYMLEPDFESVFRDESSPELIFAIFYSELEPGSGNRNGSSGRSQTGTHPSNMTLPSLPQTPAELYDVVPVAAQPQWLGLSDFFIDNVLKPANVDSRSDITWNSVSTSTGQKASWINKYIGEVYSGTRLPTSDLIIYRFAEAILLKAEIENALGNTGEALTQLNKIAERAYGEANHYAGLNREQIDNAILDERVLEFVLEGKSWFDMRRFGQAFQRIPTLAGRKGEKNGNILLLPVAQDVINRNPNITQTEGY